MSIKSEKKRAKQRYGLCSGYCSYADRNSCRIQKIQLQATHQTLSLLPPHGNDNRIFIEWVRRRLNGFLAQMIQCIPPDTVIVGQRSSSSLQLHHSKFPIHYSIMFVCTTKYSHLILYFILAYAFLLYYNCITNIIYITNLQRYIICIIMN